MTKKGLQAVRYIAQAFEDQKDKMEDINLDTWLVRFGGFSEAEVRKGKHLARIKELGFVIIDGNLSKKPG